MFDQSQAFAFDYSDDDTEVIDVEEPPRRPRVPTAELTVHVIHNGERHRRMPDLSGTSCGQQYPTQFTPVRREELTHREGRLCVVCFTSAEIAAADREGER